MKIILILLSFAGPLLAQDGLFLTANPYQYGAWQYEPSEVLMDDITRFMNDPNPVAMECYLWSSYKLECLTDSSYVFVRSYAATFEDQRVVEFYAARDYAWIDDHIFPGDYSVRFNGMVEKKYPRTPSFSGYMQWKVKLLRR